jgi:hypothetical protein
MIPIELLTMGGGALMGGLMKFAAIGQKNKADNHKMTMEAFSEKRKAKQEAEVGIQNARNAFKNDPFAKLTRRIIVLAILGLAYWQYMAGLTGLDIVMPVMVESGFNFLGIIDTTSTATEYQTFSNAVVIQDWMKHAILAIISFYFGQAAAKA